MRLKKKFVWTALVVSTIVISYLITVAYVDNQLSKRKYVNIIGDCYKVWSTRGLVTNIENRLNDANSIEAIALAFSRGAIGVEVDVYFDLEMNRFIVSHDRPYNLKNGELLTLEKLFSVIQQKNYIWLDFKKLTRLDKPGVKQAVKRLKDIMPNIDMRKRIYIESEHPSNLSYFHEEGFQTILDTQPLPLSYIGTEFVHNIYKIVFYFGDFSVMGINYGEVDNPIYNAISEKVLKNVPMFIYHVPNNPSLIRYLTRKDNVRVVLNSDETVDMFMLVDDNCIERER